MKQLSTLPYKIRLIQNQWISLTDGIRLAARIWLPETAARQPVPVLLEYIPYRNHDGIATYEDTLPGYFAGHGYAFIRVDMRGSGDS
jgi:predicted acyl esterase